jgi:hypothetical protein
MREWKSPNGPLSNPDGTLYANIHFNTGVLSAETVERIWTHYMTLMGHIADRRDLNARVTYLPVLPPAERYVAVGGIKNSQYKFVQLSFVSIAR